MIKIFISFILFIFLTGCQSNQKQSEKVELLDATVFESILEENQGTVLLVNVWATWCVPCVEEMPDLVRLAELYKDKAVKVISISIDYTDEIESKILPFIKNHKLNFNVYVNNFDSDENFINYFNTDWSGAIPASFIYDKQGNQQEFLLGKHTFEDFKHAIENHLKTGRPEL